MMTKEEFIRTCYTPVAKVRARAAIYNISLSEALAQICEQKYEIYLQEQYDAHIKEEKKS